MNSNISAMHLGRSAIHTVRTRVGLCNFGEKWFYLLPSVPWPQSEPARWGRWWGAFASQVRLRGMASK